MLSAIRLIVLIFSLGPLVYYLLCFYCVVDYFRAHRKTPLRRDFAPPISILKPVRGVDREAYENFASYCRLDYPEYELVFAVAESDDPVIPVIERLRRDFPDRTIRLVTHIAKKGANNKVNNLCRLVEAAKYEFLVMADSDVRVDADYLREVAAPFAEPAVGAVTAFSRCIPGGSIAADLDALGMCADSAPSALVARKLEGKMQFAFGWTMATTKKILAEIGGWEAMVDYHSDDFELGNRIARRGYRVELMRNPVWMVFPRETLGEFWHHELRWSIGLRNVRPAGYVGMIFTHGLPWALLAALAAPWSALASSILLAYLVLRLGVAWTAGVWGLRDHAIARKLWLVPLRDVVSFLVWVEGFFTNKISWRGLEYRVKEGLLVPVAPAAAVLRVGDEKHQN
ncbi:MAG TPA: bacteriohopanetetrol glucosamine biosynthesis glycosyltransferase HpnI [Candidatus Acidoferrum sp.]|nr:bacteriohopanetetrol glucosamine biosynthesis glycosyltransferase HpnI [Candidatus Acidoferrum sp.]